MESPEYTSNLPRELRAGDLWTWNDEVRSDLDTSYTCKYRFIGPGKLELTGSLSGSTHTFTSLPSVTTKLPPGAYTVFRLWSKTGDTRTDGPLRVEILPDASKLEGAEDVSDWIDRSITNIKTAIIKLTEKPNTTVTVEGISYTRHDLPTLIKTYHSLKLEEIKRDKYEKLKRGEDPGGRVLLRFKEAT